MADPKNGGNVWKSLKPVSYEVNIYTIPSWIWIFVSTFFGRAKCFPNSGSYPHARKTKKEIGGGRKPGYSSKYSSCKIEWCPFLGKSSMEIRDPGWISMDLPELDMVHIHLQPWTHHRTISEMWPMKNLGPKASRIAPCPHPPWGWWKHRIVLPPGQMLGECSYHYVVTYVYKCNYIYILYILYYIYIM